jgi:ankyrin repeat protein
LIDAAQSGSLKKVKFLVENGADVNKRRPINGLSALFEAGFSAYLDIATYLIDNGANVNIENFDGESVLYRSIGSEKGSLKMVQLLIDNGANVNHIDKSDKSTALMKAAEYNLSDIVALLIEKGASKEGVDTYGKTAKMYAEESATRSGVDQILTFFE